MNKLIAGDTRKFTWVASGHTPTEISVSILDTNKTLVTSSTMTSSGNGHYFADMTLPSSIGVYTASWIATISGKPYINKERFIIVDGDA